MNAQARSVPTDLRQRWGAPSRPRPIVIIGAGGIVNDAHLPAYRAGGLPVAGVHDADASRSRATAERWAIPEVFPRLEAALAVPDAVFDVALPPGELARMVALLPEGSVALLQKPMGLDLADATAIRRTCRARGITAAVNFQLRFSPMMLALADATLRGLLGRVVELEVHVHVRTPWERWPFMATLAHMEIAMHSIHYLDLARSILGEPKGVYARTVRHPDARDLASSRTSAILDYGEDVRCCLSVDHHHRHGARHQTSEVRIEGTKGAALATMGVNLDYPKGRPDALEIALEGGDWTNVPLEGNWFPDAFLGTMSNLQRFAAGEDRVLHTSVEDAWRTMALVEACYESDRKGGTPLPRDPEPLAAGGRP